MGKVYPKEPKTATGRVRPVTVITDEIVFTENSDKGLFKNRKY